MTYDLPSLGWTAEFAKAFDDPAFEGLVPARVAAQHRSGFLLYAQAGELAGKPSGRLRHLAAGAADFPVVGDWVAARADGAAAAIEAVLPRKSTFVRSDADPTKLKTVAGAVVLAANLDLVLVVTAAFQDLNIRRLERYLAAAWDSGARPVVILTKTDLVDNAPELVRLIEAAAPGTTVLPVCNRTGEGVQGVRALIEPGQTAAFLGSSGVGKSTLINGLLGRERQSVSEVRKDGRGRHTTTVRELILLEGGGLVLDTPGMRLFAPVDDAGLDAAFADIEALARGCRFGDCRHEAEPGCAVQAAVAAGVLAADRLAGWAKLHRELAHIERKDDKLAESAQRKRWRAIHKAGRARTQEKRRGWD